MVGHYLLDERTFTCIAGVGPVFGLHPWLFKNQLLFNPHLFHNIRSTTECYCFHQVVGMGDENNVPSCIIVSWDTMAAGCDNAELPQASYCLGIGTENGVRVLKNRRNCRVEGALSALGR